MVRSAGCSDHSRVPIGHCVSCAEYARPSRGLLEQHARLGGVSRSLHAEVWTARAECRSCDTAWHETDGCAVLLSQFQQQVLDLLQLGTRSSMARVLGE